MIGIGGVASYVPNGKLDNLAQAIAFGESDRFITDKIGALYLPVKDRDQETSDLAVESVLELSTRFGLPLESIDALVVVTQNPDGAGLPHTAAIVHSKLGLPSRVAAFDLSLGCSGYIYGLSILKGLMEQAHLKNGILVTADPYSKVIDREDRVTSLLFGDAATATWLCGNPEWHFGCPLLETDGAGGNSLRIDERRKLSMHGRRVFDFAARRVPEQIERYLTINQLRHTDIDLFCIHQGSSAIVDAISRRFPDVKERFVKDISHTGNTVSSSIPLLIEKNVLGRSLNSALLCGFGVGLSWATNVIKKV